MNDEQTNIVPEVFTVENGYKLQLIHLQKDGLLVRLSHPAEDDAAIMLPQEDIIKLKKWLDKYYGLFF